MINIKIITENADHNRNNNKKASSFQHLMVNVCYKNQQFNLYSILNASQMIRFYETTENFSQF
jgi:hypothetical protein